MKTFVTPDMQNVSETQLIQPYKVSARLGVYLSELNQKPFTTAAMRI